MPSSSPSRPRRRSDLLVGTAISVATVLLCLLGLEFGGRAISARAQIDEFPNFIDAYRTALGSRSTHDFDPDLGYVPQAGYRGDAHFEGVMITIDGETLRTPGEGVARPSAGPDTILAVGDSFVFGAEVPDGSSWPAHLERLAGRRVLNGGVGGYGLDQIVLRAEILAAKLSPGLLIVGFIPDDVERTELHTRNGVAKPWFRIVDGRLERMNRPVPLPDPAASRLDPLRRVLGYSYLADFVARRLDLLQWWYGDAQPHKRAHDQGQAVACLLMERLGDFALKRGLRTAVFAQYPPEAFEDRAFEAAQKRIAAATLDCARRAGLETLDGFAAVEAARRDGSVRRLFINGHMNDAGNRLVAETLAAWLRSASAR